MAAIADYKQIIRIIDRIFTYHERRLADLRVETVQRMREELQKAHIPTHSTPGLSPGESSGVV